MEDGNQKNVVILTRDVTYRKNPKKVGGLAKLIYGRNKEFVETLRNRHATYNQTLAYI